MLTKFLDKLTPKSSPQQAAFNSKELEAPAGVAPQMPTWKVGDIVLDRYQIDQEFSGAMGKVYIAQHLGWKIPVAIKAPKADVLADAEGANRILNEANSWVRMGMHPNVATCYYVLNLGNIPYLFIEYVDGGNLKDWLQAGRCKDLRTSLSLAIQFCHGMEFTHARGIIHRDIKPQNILLTKNSLVKITDFGIIQNISSPAHTKRPLTGSSGPQTIGFRGTPAYASPEQFKDSHQVDLRTDIFSFGICLWMMLCGKKPYASNEIEEKLDPTSGQRSTPPFPESLRNLLKKVVSFDIEQRYQSFKALRHDLNDIYREIFNVGCPYMELDFSDLQAENFNNRAVSLLELGKINEGAAMIAKALDTNDALPEAIFNYNLLKWKHGKTRTDRIFRQIQAARQRIQDSKLLDALLTSVKCDMLSHTWENTDDESRPKEARKKFYPEFILCMPQNSLDVFRSGQMHRSNRENVKDLLEKKKYESCLKVLNKGWPKIYYRPDSIFINAYETLLSFCKSTGILSAIRQRTIAGKGAGAKKIMLLPGSKKLLTLDKSGKVVIRSLQGNSNTIRMLGNQQNVTCFTMSPDGNRIALGTKDGSIDILSLKSGENEKSFVSKGAITSLSFGADSLSITSGSRTGHLQVNTLNSQKPFIMECSGSGAITAISYFSKHDDFVTGSADGKIRFWSSSNRECIRIAEAHAMPVTTISPADNGLFFISASADRKVKIWNRQSGQCLKSIDAHDDTISSALVLPGSHYFVSGSDDDILKIWHIESGKCNLTLDGRGDGITSLALGPQPHMFLSGRRDGAVVLWMIIYDLEMA